MLKTVFKKRPKKIADVKEVIEYLIAIMQGKSKSSVLSLSKDGGKDILENLPNKKRKVESI